MPAQRTIRLLLIAGMILAARCSFSAEGVPPTPKPNDTRVTLVVRDGRILTGHIDERSNDEVVWLRVSRGAVTLSTGFTWDLIEEVHIGNARHSAADFRAIVESYASAAPKFTETGPIAARPGETIATPRSHSLFARVQSLQVFAEAANWDRDEESDGIALRILPLDRQGQVVAVDGSLSVELIAREFVSGRDNRGFPVVGQWSQRVRSADFLGAQGAIYQLQFTRPLDHELSLLSVGMVRVELTVRGQGHFDAVAPARLKLYNPIRDQLDQHQLRYDAFGRYRARHW